MIPNFVTANQKCRAIMAISFEFGITMINEANKEQSAN